MLKYITDYIIDLYYFLTVTPKMITVSKTIPNNNVVAFVYAVINSEGNCYLLATYPAT